jgi:hypothetical protein
MSGLPARGKPGDADEMPRAVAVTRGPKHHFFGYYDKCPWDKTGRYLLANEIDFADRQPKEGEALTVGMVDLEKNNRYIPFDTTLAWCWQQGTMLQWLGSAPDRQVVYNSVDTKEKRYVATIRDVHSGKTRTLPRPVYALSPDGHLAVSLAFDRLHRLRPGYGYLALPEHATDDPAPKDDGLWLLDVARGDSKLLVPFAQAAELEPVEIFRSAHHWFNHALFSPNGKRVVFLHRWRNPETERRHLTRMLVFDLAKGELKLVVDTGMVSHFDWRDDDTLLAWARNKDKKDRFYLIDVGTRRMTVVGDGVLDQDGHCSYSPDRRWVLNDTYPDKERRMQTLMLFRPKDSKRIDVGKYHLPLRYQGEYRCDLHPRFNRDGTQVCFDSGHEETRQIYVVDVSQLVQS